MTHYFDEKQHSRENPREIRTRVGSGTLTFLTAAGMFSPRRVDTGSKLLATKSLISPKSTVLDLGCGWGYVGIAIAKREPSTAVTFAEKNARAVRYTKKNLVNNSVKGTVIQSDGFAKVKGSFDTILFNPPFSAGKKVWQRLIEEAKKHLKEGGTLQAVARHSKGGASLKLFLKELFGNVETVAKGSGFRIYRSSLQTNH